MGNNNIIYNISKQQYTKNSKIIQRLSENFGKEIIFENEKYYTFPTPEELKDVSVEKYRELGLGFRDIRLYETTHAILDGKVDLKKLEQNPNTQEVREELLSLSGEVQK